VLKSFIRTALWALAAVFALTSPVSAQAPCSECSCGDLLISARAPLLYRATFPQGCVRTKIETQSNATEPAKKRMIVWSREEKVNEENVCRSVERYALAL
jgi:hypothetical protein